MMSSKLVSKPGMSLMLMEDTIAAVEIADTETDSGDLAVLSDAPAAGASA